VSQQEQASRCLTYLLEMSLTALGVRSKPALHKVICPLACSALADSLEPDEAERLRMLIIGETAD